MLVMSRSRVRKGQGRMLAYPQLMQVMRRLPSKLRPLALPPVMRLGWARRW